MHSNTYQKTIKRHKNCFYLRTFKQAKYLVGFLCILLFLLIGCVPNHSHQLVEVTFDFSNPKTKTVSNDASMQVGYVDKDYYIKAVPSGTGSYCSFGTGYAKANLGVLKATIAQGKWTFHIINTDKGKYDSVPTEFDNTDKATEVTVEKWINLNTTFITLLQEVTTSRMINFYYETDLSKGYTKQNIHIIYEKLDNGQFVTFPQPENQLKLTYQTGKFTGHESLVLSGEEGFAEKGAYIAKVYVTNTATNSDLFVDTLSFVIGAGPVATVVGHCSLEKEPDYVDPTEPDTNWIQDREDNTKNSTDGAKTTDLNEINGRPSVSNEQAYVMKSDDTSYDIARPSKIVTRFQDPARGATFGINTNGKTVVIDVSNGNSTGDETKLIHLGSNNTMTLYNQPESGLNDTGVWARLKNENKTRVHSTVTVAGNSILNVGTTLTTAHLDVIGAGISYGFPIELERGTYYFAPVLCQSNAGGTINVSGDVTVSGNVCLGSFDAVDRGVILDSGSKCVYNITNGAQLNAVGGQTSAPSLNIFGSQRRNVDATGIYVRGKETEVSILLSGYREVNNNKIPSQIFAHSDDGNATNNRGIVLENCNNINITVENGAVINSSGAAIDLSSCQNVLIRIEGEENITNANKAIVLKNTTATIIYRGKEFKKTAGNTAVTIKLSELQ